MDEQAERIARAFRLADEIGGLEHEIARTGAKTPIVKPFMTSREVEVLSLISEGLSNAEIAKKLFISDETVKSHVRHILQKMGARTRAHAIGLAFRSGIFRADTAP